MLAAQGEVEATLKTLSLNNRQSVLAPLYRQSNTLGNKVDKKIEEAQQPVVEKDVKLDKLNTDGDFGKDDEDSEKVMTMGFFRMNCWRKKFKS